ncbi:hypothetical protein ACBI99_04070 [Nonomuraea sp. ATR24]|uniref:hypothetical protein n=1 Tax=Nonomuraea TaxID=83681 RepID=UPI001C5EB0C1|nr:hypothetical protein [Nonomuraea ceibae]
MATMLTRLSVTELAQVLFASAVQPSDTASGAVSAREIRAAIDRRLCACGGHAGCAAYVAQEAGDHPDAFVTRMRWALEAVAGAYPGPRAAA